MTEQPPVPTLAAPVGEDGTRREWPVDSDALQAELERALVANHRRSVAAVSFDAAGRPVDVWGTPFRAQFKRDWLHCISAGQDRKFGTPDDVTATPAR